MKKYLRYCVLFALPVVILAALAEYVIRQVPNTYQYKYEWMQENAKDVEALVLGSSHAFYGIRPGVMREKAFNLANPCQNLEEDRFLLLHWKDEYRHLKTVICTISYFTLFNQGLRFHGESYRCRYYNIYMHSDLYPSLSPYYNLEIAEWKTALKKLKTLFMGPGGVDWFCDEYGAECYNDVQENEPNTWDGKGVAEWDTAETWDYVEKNCKLLRDIADFCRDRGIRLVFLTPPCYHTYYNNIDQRQWAKTQDIIRSFQEEYDIPYFDHLKDHRFGKEDFYNSVHLLDKGAEKLTRILEEEMGNGK